MAIITGTLDDDILTGTAEADTISGDAGNDQIDGGGGVDTLFGGTGDDTLISSDADALLDGGDGDDLVVIDRSTSALYFDLRVDSFAGAGQALTDGTLVRNVERLSFSGGSAGDFVVGGAGIDLLRGGAGADQLHGGGGADVLEGGVGDDYLAGGDGADSVDGGAGDDVLYDNNAFDPSIMDGSADSLRGGDGDDRLYSQGADALVDGGSGVDWATLFRQTETRDIVFSIAATQGGGATLVDGTVLLGLERVSLYSGSGNDQLSGSTLADTFYGGAGDDTLEGGGGSDVLDGGGGADTLRGSGTLYGGDGDDLLDARVGGGTLQGGEGNDTLLGGLDVGSYFEAGYGDDRLEGGNAADVFDLGFGLDNVLAGGGDDEIHSNYGADALIDGGDGIDRLHLNRAADTLGSTLSLAATWNGGSQTLADGTVIRNVERLMFYGGSGDDTVVGGDFIDTLYGDLTVNGIGNDHLEGGGGADYIDGGGGNNVLIGGEGGDTIYSGEGNDLVAGDAGNDIVRSGGGIDTLTGGLGDDDLDGGFGADDIDGGEGNDFLIGGGAAGGQYDDGSIDTLRGGAGDDQIYVSGPEALVDGGDGIDVLVLRRIGQSAPVVFSIDANLAGGSQTLADGTVIRNVEIVNGGGGSGDDIISGGAMVDSINGGDGNDLLSGGGGSDYLDAGNGDNTVFGDAGHDDIRAHDGNDTLDGGAGNDQVFGGGGVNRLTGGAGDDTIYSNALSTAVFSGARADYDLALSSYGVTVTDQRAGAPDGVDIVYGFGLLQFSDMTIAADGSGNLPPTDATLSANGVAENAANGTPVGTVVTVDPNAGDTFTFSLLDSAGGRFAIDAASGVVSVANAALLDFEAAVSHTINVRVVDSGGSAIERSFNIVVGNVNEAPTIVSGGGAPSLALAVAENTAAGFASVAATDPDSGTSIQYGIVGGADALAFVINADTGALRFAAAPDFDIPGDADADNVYDVVVHASDGALADTQAIAVTVNNANEAPVITANLGADVEYSIVENNTAQYNLLAVDPDAGTALTYSIIGGADAARFSIGTNGVLQFPAALNFEAPGDSNADNRYEVQVQVSDGALTDTQRLTLSVTNANEAPAITSNGGGPSAALSREQGGTAVTTVTANDPDAATNLAYAIGGGADAAAFVIDPQSGALAFASAPVHAAPSDANADNVYEVVVQVSDGVLTDTQALAVTVTQGNLAPAIISNGGGASAAISLAENLTAVTSVVASDPNPGTSIVYSIAGGVDAARFFINANTGALRFQVPPNFEVPGDSGANNVYDVVVRAFDGALEDTQAIAVTVTNTNEAPVFVGVSAAYSLPESGNTGITTIVATDPEGLPVTYSISSALGGVDASRFTINPTTGHLAFVSPPDFEAPADSDSNNVYNVTIVASDGVTPTQRAHTITVTDVADNANNIIGTPGDDVLTGTALSDTMFGLGGNDRLDGLGGIDVLDGGDGDDFLVGGAAGDNLIGGAGSDYAGYGDSGVGVSVNLAAGTGSGGTAQGDSLSGIENLNGSDFADTLTGDALANFIAAGAGVDSVFGGDGADQLYGGAGDDTLRGESGDDVLGGDAGADTLDGGSGFDRAYYAGSSAGVAIDLQAGSASGGDATGDILIDIEAVFGSQGADTLGGNDTGNDLLGLGGDDLIFGRGGDDFLYGDAGADTLDGDAGNDFLYGGAGNDTLRGGAGYEQMSGDAGNDLIDGGADFAMARFSGAFTDYQITYNPDASLSVTDLRAGSPDGTDTLNNIDKLRFTTGVVVVNVAPDSASLSANTVAENAANGTLVGTVSATDPNAPDTLGYALLDDAGGRFAIDAASGALTVASATLLDFEAAASHAVTVRVTDNAGLWLDRAFTIVVANANEAPVITSNGGGASAVLAIAENGSAVTTVTAADPDASSTLSYVIAGGADAARFTIDANTGALAFAAAPDYEAPGDANADNVYDVAVQVSDGVLSDVQALTVTVTDASDSGAITGTPGDDFLSGTAIGDRILGLAGNDSIEGLEGADVLEGGDGDDYLDGESFYSGISDLALDTLLGGAGNDVLVSSGRDALLDGGSGTDSLYLERASETVNFNFSIAANLLGPATLADGTVVSGIESITFIGGAGNDSVTGGSLRDSLYGGIGADTLNGGEGNDYVRGDAGSDTLRGGGGDDQLESGDADALIDGGDGSDTAYVFRSSATIGFSFNLAGNLNGASQTLADGTVIRNIETLQFVGGSGQDNITGGANADYLSGNSGNDVLNGAGGIDSLSGGDGNDTLNGGADDDWLDGGAGVDSLIGGGGLDTLAGGAGADTLNGGAGSDVADYRNSAAVTVNLTTGTASGGDAQGDVLTAIEDLYGSAFNDTLTGDAGSNLLSAFGGDDTLNGSGGNDQLYGGDGNDRLNGGDGDDNLYGWTGSDVLNGDAGNDYIVGEDGGDTLNGGVGNDTLYGGSGDDALNGGGDGDYLVGEDGADIINGGAGNDNLLGGAGADSLDGGSGFDYALFYSAASGIIANLTTGTVSGSEADGDTLINIEGLAGSSFGDNFIGDAATNGLYGFGGNDILSGAGGADTLDGGDGDDLLIGGTGADALVGGPGFDRASYATSAAVAINLQAGTASGGEAAGDTFNGIEALTGSAFNDSLTGNGIGNLLEGLGGNDVLVGGSGNDLLDGGDGNDTLTGGGGLDTLIGGAGDDTLDSANADARIDGRAGSDLAVISRSSATLAMQFSVAGNLNGGSQTLADGTLVQNVERVQFTAGGGNDVLAGGDLADTLIGGGGNDALEGGAGADTLNGGAGIDTLVYASSNAAVTVNLAAATAAGGHAAGDAIAGIESVTGSAFNDALIGNGADNALAGLAGSDNLSGAGGADTLSGGAGVDLLTGGAGRDVMTGGSEADVFDFDAIGDSAVGTAADLITDFELGLDDIDFSTIDARSNVGGNQAFAFIGAAAFTGVSGQLRSVQDATNNTTHVYGDVNGDRVADFEVLLVGQFALSSSDFVL